MAKIADVLQTERNRQAPTEWDKIHIFQMGDFYRAYEWSAWLIVAITYNDKVRKETKDRKPLKESKKALATTGEEFCFVGFPIKSVDKFIPTRLNFESVEDKHIILTIELPTPSDGSKVTYERLNEAFTKWKAAIPLSTKEDTIDENGNKRTPKPKPANALPAATSPNAVTRQPTGGGILSQIMAYRLEMHTDNDNRQFIASLQQQILNIL